MQVQLSRGDCWSGAQRYLQRGRTHGQGIRVVHRTVLHAVRRTPAGHAHAHALQQATHGYTAALGASGTVPCSSVSASVAAHPNIRVNSIFAVLRAYVRGQNVVSQDPDNCEEGMLLIEQGSDVGGTWYVMVHVNAVPSTLF